MQRGTHTSTRRRAWKGSATRQSPTRRVSAGALVLSVLALAIGGAASAQDPSRNPHYFGPYPNWANSPLTLPDADSRSSLGNGTGATAEATVGVNGSDHRDHRHGRRLRGYGQRSKVENHRGPAPAPRPRPRSSRRVPSSASPSDSPGSGLHRARWSRSHGGGAGSGATATAFGAGRRSHADRRRERLHDPDGEPSTSPTTRTASRRRATSTSSAPNCAPGGGRERSPITGVIVDEPGSGYSTAPGVAILNGTQLDPVPIVRTNARSGGEGELRDPVDRDGHLRLELQQGAERDDRRPRPGGGGGSRATATIVTDGVPSRRSP